MEGNLSSKKDPRGSQTKELLQILGAADIESKLHIDKTTLMPAATERKKDQNNKLLEQTNNSY